MKFLTNLKNKAEYSGTQISSSEEDDVAERSLPIRKHPKLPKIMQIKPIPQKMVTSKECYIITSEEMMKQSSKCDNMKLEPMEKKAQVICSICINSITLKKPRELGTLACGHTFCIGCIGQSSKFSNKCPYCRATYCSIKNGNSTVLVEEKELDHEQNFQDEPCYVCGRNDDFDRLLVCENCNFSCCHTYCDNRLRGRFPQSTWFCLDCDT